MKQKLRPIILVLALGLAASACSKDAGKPASVKGPAPQAPLKQTGEALFRERCRECHMVNGEGGAVGPDLSIVGANRSRAFLEQAIWNPSQLYPGTVMPHFDIFSAEQVKQLVDYLSGLQ